ncbi:YqaA family protein [Salinimonas sediminis]|uniref:DedA family protein n=1 Tax=Salinimonas sediminis TaxID=2303538 RepID=A0A346NHC2_9ALTE|nr:VTT domain-containing protein [Salinimonas sediminis]AXR04929.1 DedA family protein [Salinimonas sediminis]
MGIQKRLKTSTRKLVESDNMLSGITVASLLESTIVPIPLEAVLVPLMQARRDKLWLIALMATLGCLVGAIIGYGIGYFLFDLVGDWVINTLSSQSQFDQVKQQMQNQGFWFVMTLGVAPIPFQIAMLAAGATKFSLVMFVVATVIARSLRYFGLALAVYVAGNKAERLIKRYKGWAIAGITALILLIWYLTTLLG